MHLHDPVYRPDTCAYCGADTWCEYIRDRPQCRACKIERFYERLLYPPLGYLRLDWGREILRDLYGTVQPEDGLRAYDRAYISMAKKNAKSSWAAGLPLYHLLCENEPRAEAYGAAASKEQATTIFRHACEYVRGNPVLNEKLRILPGTKRILRRDGSGFYSVLSADGDMQDGFEPSLIIFDELHRWKTARAKTLYDVLTKGTISRKEALAIEVTTVGEENTAPVWQQEHEFAEKVIAGAIPGGRFYCRIWQADQKRLENEPGYWKSREARVAANPSHEDRGGFLKDAKIYEELKKALVNPNERPGYLRYNLNLMVSSIQERAIDIDRWQQCGGDVDLRTWPEYDVEYLIRKWALLDKPCWAGVDMAWTTDLAAVSLLFPPLEDEGSWSVLLFFWLPEDNVPEIERACKVPLRDWVRRGFITAEKGSYILVKPLVDKIHWADEMFELREVCFDNWRFEHSGGAELEAEGYTTVRVKQRYDCLSGPTKKLLEIYLARSLRHGNNPVLNWNASCVALQGDGKDNVEPRKPERSKTASRIDGFAATVNAMYRALVNEEVRPGVRAIG